MGTPPTIGDTIMTNGGELEWGTSVTWIIHVCPHEDVHLRFGLWSKHSSYGVLRTFNMSMVCTGRYVGEVMLLNATLKRIYCVCCRLCIDDVNVILGLGSHERRGGPKSAHTRNQGKSLPLLLPGLFPEEHYVPFVGEKCNEGQEERPD